MYGFGYRYSPKGIYVPSGGGGALDPDAEAFLTAATITDPTEISAVNQLVIDMKDAGIWTKMKAVYPFVGGTSTTQKWNLVNPVDSDAAFRLTFSGGWTHSATGALSNGTNGYANTYLIPNSDLTGTIGVSSYNPDLTVSNGYISGCQNSISQTLRHQTISSSIYFRIPNLSNNPIAFVNPGFNGGSRVSTSLCYAMNSEGNTNSDTTTQTGAFPTFSVILSALSSAGVPTSYRSLTFSYYAISEGLTIPEMTDLRTAVINFQTTLGRAV